MLGCQRWSGEPEAERVSRCRKSEVLGRDVQPSPRLRVREVSGDKARLDELQPSSCTLAVDLGVERRGRRHWCLSDAVIKSPPAGGRWIGRVSPSYIMTGFVRLLNSLHCAGTGRHGR